MLDKDFAEKFAAEWVAAWNSHELEAVLSHYTDDFEMSSPVIIQVMGEASGKLKGKEVVGGYWAKALERLPNLHFELQDILLGVDTLTLYYKGHRGMSAELFFFNDEGMVYKSCAHYSIS
jgi:ketosteroid isomerase-like protein